MRTLIRRTGCKDDPLSINTHADFLPGVLTWSRFKRDTRTLPAMVQ
jgi:hypothetical protein